MRLCSLSGLQTNRIATRLSSSHGARTCLHTPNRRIVRAMVSEKDAEIEKAAAGSVESGLVEITKQILSTDPEARESLRRYEAAVIRLEKAKAASEELDRMFAEASRGAVASDQQSEKEQRQRADQVMADAEVAAAERLVRAAELQYEAARRDQEQWAAAATDGPERVESVKAAAIAALAGLAAEVPLVALTADGAAAASAAGPLSSALSLLSAVAACFLFGVTYRYAVRSDSANRQLRLGVVAAFGLVRASGAADVLQATAASAGGDGPLSLAVVGPAALYALESMLLFGFASVAVEAAFGQGFLKRFGEAS
ncbi:hypothetical protein PLESTB_001015900 [Pleodorina starrii]|uniref:Uncharacterized protein n=1 Tax=Pleodorina starrii TaxID=330485 RepID=A0A9W6BPF5_9CHLO|nr:hypothetical protein PLESTM_001191500 [Pleodorina starrii]GLC55698.1 hypothetical protein PLESTB_001015900 [Pleodorina starrii]GLC65445.1 hypothetical protein PLESTF_000294200 [Pleodorina starrii]